MVQVLGPGALLELEVEKLTCGGRGLGRVDGRAVFVERGLPGERVRARVARVGKRHAEAAMLEVLRPSPEGVEPFCPHYAECGGCDWQDLDYAAQLRWKRTIVVESLHHIGRAGGPDGADLDALVTATASSPLARGFRNKMEFAFTGGAGRGEPLHVGLRSWRDPSRVLDVSACGLMTEPAMAVLAAVRELARAGGAGAYDPATGRGVWRFLVLRDARRPGQGASADAGAEAAGMQAILITGPGAEAAVRVEAVAHGLLARFPGLCVVHGLRRDKAAVAHAEELVRAWGDPKLEMEVGGLRYGLSPQAFFQTNTAGAEVLFGLVENLAGLEDRPGAEVFDLYCGAGAMALRLARRAGRVTGFEIVAAATRDAAANARLNGLANCAFVAGDLRRTLADKHLPRPDVAVVDPPRAGMHPDVAARLLALAPKRIVSVSCDPATFARDVSLLLPGYELARVTPVDLFPHSHHVESVALLVRR